MLSSLVSTLLFSLASAPLMASAAPSSPHLLARDLSERVKATAAYYGALGPALLTYRTNDDFPKPPTCSLSKVTIPIENTKLSEPGSDMTLVQVVIGQGTQNYTCKSTDSKPVAAGAVALLYDANCLASSFPNLLHSLPPLMLQYTGPDFPQPIGPNSVLASLLRPLTILGAFSTDAVLSSADEGKLVPVSHAGEHFFNGKSVPTFDITSKGVIESKKDEDWKAPRDGDVAWLKLSGVDGGVTDFDLVYRVNTAGGVPPSTCKGQPESISVHYATEYWFYKKN